MWNSDERLKWYGIEPLEENEAKKIKGIYEEDCKCNFDLEGEFKCGCDWNEQITLKEHKSFQDLRLVSKRGIYGESNMAIDHLWESQVFMDPFQSMSRNIIQSELEWNSNLLTRTFINSFSCIYIFCFCYVHQFLNKYNQYSVFLNMSVLVFYSKIKPI